MCVCCCCYVAIFLSYSVQDTEVVTGLDAIREKIETLSLLNCVIDFSRGTLDAQSSDNAAIFLTVTGHFTPAKSTSARLFVQNFFLAYQASSNASKNHSYFVRNSSFRLLGSELCSSGVSTPVITPVSSGVQTTATATPSPPPVEAAPTAEPAKAIAVEVKEVEQKVVAPKDTASEKIVKKKPVEEAVSAPVKEVTAEVSNMQVSGGNGSGSSKSNRRNKKEPKGDANADNSSGSKSFADLVRGWEFTKEAETEVPKAAPVAPAKKVVKEVEVKAAPAETDVAAPTAKSGKKQAMPTQTSIYVHNVPVGIRQRDLREIFSVHGKILRIDCHSDRGFAFVNFESQDIVKAVLKVENIKCNGNVLRIESRDRSNDGLSKVPSPHEHGSNNNSGEGNNGNKYRKVTKKRTDRNETSTSNTSTTA